MAIQNRRGVYSDFTPTKMVPGEFAVVNSGDPNSTSGKGVYMSFADGQAKRLVMEEDVQNEVAKATEDIAEQIEDAVADDLEAAQAAATTASTKASEAAASATQAAQTVANIIDNTLTQAGKAADAKVTGDELAGLKEDLNLLEDTFDDLIIHDKSANLFNKNGEIFAGKLIVVTTTIPENVGTLVNDSGASVQYIPFEGAGTYSVLYPQNKYGQSNIYLCLYDSNKAYLREVAGTKTVAENAPHPCVFTITPENAVDVAYIGYCFSTNTLDTAMFVKASTYPEEYIPYQDNGYVFNGNVSAQNVVGLSTAIENEIAPIESDVDTLDVDVAAIKNKLANGITPEDTTFIDTTEPSANLFNKSGTIKSKTALGIFSSNQGQEITTSGMSVQYVPFSGEGSYSLLYPRNHYGRNIVINLYNSSFGFLRSVTGSSSASENVPSPATFSISAASAEGVAYIGYCFKSDTIDTAMVVKSDTYPEEYIPYQELTYTLSPEINIPEESIPVYCDINPLSGKSVVFDGDSICSGQSSGGWARYIGEANTMDWHNVGVGGGTITADLYSSGSPRHWVSRYIDTIHANYPELDYLILEGGTNDADLLTNEQIGTIDPANWTTFDDTTFVGAMESLFYKALNYYPTAKIGFIVAQKMGTWSGYGYEAGDSPSNRRRKKFFDIAMQVCEKWGIPFIDLWDGSPLCPKLPCYYDSSKDAEGNIEAGKAYMDGQHLTQVGYNIISPKIEAWMKTL